MREFPDRFKANLGHHDRVSVLPPNAVELAFNSIIKFFLFDKLSSNQNSGVSRYNSRSCIARSFFILPAGPLS
ncbi:MAG: hypothetical protein IH820_03130 [Bacteroidetes bacterium]|nr:hypothetical protein [Bacteroidota bacterium]